MKLKIKNNLGRHLYADLNITVDNAPVVVFSHGFKSGRQSPRNVEVSKALLAGGLSTLLLDFTGHGESEGSLEESTTDQQAMDLKFFLDELEKRGFKKIGLSGSSFGGASALMRAAEDKRVKTLVLRASTMKACFSFKKPCFELASKIKIPTLLVVGENDHPIREENEEFLQMLNCPKKIHLVKGGFHVFEEPEQIADMLKATVAWFKKYLI